MAEWFPAGAGNRNWSADCRTQGFQSEGSWRVAAWPGAPDIPTASIKPASAVPSIRVLRDANCISTLLVVFWLRT